MNQNWTIYDLGSGEIQKTVSVPDLEHLTANIEEGCAAIEGHWSPDTHCVVEGAVSALPPRPGQVAADRFKAIAEVNRLIGEVRRKFITTIPGQEMIYQAKEAEALSFLQSDPLPVSLEAYPFIFAETGILAATGYEVAQIWVNMSHQWRTVAATLEALRTSAIGEIETARSTDGLELVLSKVRGELAQHE